MKIHTSNEAFILKVVYEVSIFISETSSISSSSQILLSYVKMYMFICNRVRINDYKSKQNHILYFTIMIHTIMLENLRYVTVLLNMPRIW